MAFPAPHLKTPPASHSTGAAEICPRPKGTTKKSSNPIRSPDSPFLQNSIYTLRGSNLSPCQGETCGGIHVRNGEWGGGEEEIKPKKTPKPRSERSPEPGVIQGNHQDVMSTSYLSRRTKNSTQQKLQQHRTHTPNSFFPRQRQVWKTVPRQIKQRVSTAKRFVQNSKSCLKRKRKLKNKTTKHDSKTTNKSQNKDPKVV